MNKVVTINLGGRAYQLEEAGYDALRAYLAQAQERLAQDPGKDEIIADLEQAIAEKCDAVLSPHKSVVTTSEVQRIIDEMGPVEGDAKHSADHSSTDADPKAPRRFYLNREHAVVAGVCAGLAQYFDIDVTWVRILFIALTVFTGGFWILLYIALAILVPYADTAQERAAARGEAFNAEALVQRAKERWGESYERVTGSKFDWDNLDAAHKNHRQWKEMRKQQKREWKRQWKYAHRSRPPFYGMIMAALSLMWILALLSLITHHAIFGWVLPVGFPVWLAIILLFIAFHALTGPFRGVGYDYRFGPHGEYQWHSDPWDGFMGVITFIFLVIAFAWAYTHVPEMWYFIHHPIASIKEWPAQIASWWNR
ncbi:MAG TPA: PspC domain-containing protein [Candidatus Paceibacterota bacterium]|nr:PspC domain-containing protein [Candidatus Paceibacterota bacterium]